MWAWIEMRKSVTPSKPFTSSERHRLFLEKMIKRASGISSYHVTYENMSLPLPDIRVLLFY